MSCDPVQVTQHSVQYSTHSLPIHMAAFYHTMFMLPSCNPPMVRPRSFNFHNSQTALSDTHNQTIMLPMQMGADEEITGDVLPAHYAAEGVLNEERKQHGTGAAGASQHQQATPQPPASPTTDRDDSSSRFDRVAESIRQAQSLNNPNKTDICPPRAP